MRTAVREASVAAYYDFIGDGRRNKQHAAIIRALTGKPAGLTRAELVDATALPINVVTPRVHELLHPKAGPPTLEELPHRLNASGAKASPVRLIPLQDDLFGEAA